jgi:hypothetical protein
LKDNTGVQSLLRRLFGTRRLYLTTMTTSTATLPMGISMMTARWVIFVLYVVELAILDGVITGMLS